MSIIMKIELVVEEDSDEKSSGASDAESECFPPANNSLLSNKESASGETDITLPCGSGSGVTVDNVPSIAAADEVILRDIFSSGIKEEDMKCDGGFKDHSGEVNKDLFRFDNASVMTDTKREKEEQRKVETMDEKCALTYEHVNREETKEKMHLKKPNTADTEDKCQRHEQEEEQVKNEEDTNNGERRKRKREDKEAAETVAENMTAPGDVLKVDVNRNKKRKSEEGDDEVARKDALGQILKPEKRHHRAARKTRAVEERKHDAKK
ncbi:hypothetical protein HPB51_003300 [Rhipicephalus microplus]|uniref:Uncharacterized protein n=1 Tax=Rhipicephalus microplus TaxID=6941 RepID=A0A9J6EXW4_RHIMP|nr:hypothetical protein HPB51_003300 [Rhipicephalus microplus]